MRYKEERQRITIEPTNDVEIAYIEEVFGLKQDGDSIKLVRKNAFGLGCIAYLETKIEPQPSDRVECWIPRSIPEFLDNSSMPDQHATNVGEFAYIMHQRLQEKEEEGFVGHDDPTMLEEFQDRLQAALDKGNFVDVANFALFLHFITRPKQS
jgi:hypothetical protein